MKISKIPMRDWLIHSRVLTHLVNEGSLSHIDWYRRSFEYIMREQLHQRTLVEAANKGQLSKVTQMDPIALRTQSIRSVLNEVNILC